VFLQQILASKHLYTLPQHSQLVQTVTLVNKDLAKWMKTTVLHMSSQGCINPTIENFHHATFLKESDSFFIKSLEKICKNCTCTEDHKTETDWASP
jgi:hypothetical protein